MKFASVAILANLARASALKALGGPSYPTNVTAQNYTDVDGVVLQGFLSLPTIVGDGKVPAVIILHDQDGVNTYEQQRATMMANELGYVGFAADVYGVESILPPPDQGGWGGARTEFVSQFTGNPTLFTQRIRAAVNHVRSLPEVDADHVALVGYCLGGTGVVHYLNVAGGEEGRASAAVGIHPSLLDWPGPIGEIAVPSLFLTGGNDFLTSPQTMTKLESDMEGAATDSWETVRYAGIEHAFSNWFSNGYDDRANARSWESMTSFLAGEFGQIDYETVSPPPGPLADGEMVEYPGPDTGGTTDPVVGYLAAPDTAEEGQRLPAVIILPNEPEADDYEKQRATQIASDFGYVGFVANSGPASLSYIEAAIKYVQSLENVDPNQIAIVGFGRGGSDALLYAFTPGGMNGESVKVIASFHGNMTAFDFSGNITAEQVYGTSDFKPHILIASGVEGDAMSDIVGLESELMKLEANYEISRYSDTQQGFTNWNDNEGRYNPRSSARSFEVLESVFGEVFVPSAAHVEEDEGSSTEDEGGSLTTDEGGSLITDGGGSSTTDEGGSSTTDEGGSSTTDEGGSSTTDEGGSSTTDEGGSSTTDEGTSANSPTNPPSASTSDANNPVTTFASGLVLLALISLSL